MNILPPLRVVSLLLAGAVAAGTSVPAAAAPPPRCTARPVPTDSQVVTCLIDPSSFQGPARFVAVFAGSHDDTRIALEATLDGQPLVCRPGSRTSLFAEDGEVRLDCGFEVAARPGGVTTLAVSLTVHHAQFLSSSLDRE